MVRFAVSNTDRENLDKLCYKLPKAKQSLPCVGGWYCIDADLRKTCQEKKKTRKKRKEKEGKLLDISP